MWIFAYYHVSVLKEALFGATPHKGLVGFCIGTALFHPKAAVTGLNTTVIDEFWAKDGKLK
jgi:hypothetical protein